MFTAITIKLLTIVIIEQTRIIRLSLMFTPYNRISVPVTMAKIKIVNKIIITHDRDMGLECAMERASD